MKVTNFGHPHAARGDSKGGILDHLKFVDGRRVPGDREPDGTCVGENGFDEGLESDEKGLFGLAPGGASQCSHDVETRGGALNDCVDVRGEGEMSVEGDP